MGTHEEGIGDLCRRHIEACMSDRNQAEGGSERFWLPHLTCWGPVKSQPIWGIYCLDLPRLMTDWSESPPPSLPPLGHPGAGHSQGHPVLLQARLIWVQTQAPGEQPYLFGSVLGDRPRSGSVLWPLSQPFPPCRHHEAGGEQGRAKPCPGHTPQASSRAGADLKPPDAHPVGCPLSLCSPLSCSSCTPATAA